MTIPRRKTLFASMIRDDARDEGALTTMAVNREA
jgi:hypothetical protein